MPNKPKGTDGVANKEHLRKTLELVSAIIFTTLSSLFGITEHSILAILFGFLAIILAIVLVADKSISIWPKKRLILGVFFGLLALSLIPIAVEWARSITLKEAQRELEKDSGVLLPGDDPRFRQDTPDVTLILGSIYVSTKQTTDLPVISFFKRRLLKLSVQSKGASISGEFLDKSGKIIAELETNRFTLNQNNYFKKERPDRSTLIIRDQENVEVLNLRFLNKRVFSLTGRIRLPNTFEVEITDTNIVYTKNGMKLAYAWYHDLANVITITDDVIGFGGAP
jgi:hypothetical protein